MPIPSAQAAASRWGGSVAPKTFARRWRMILSPRLMAVRVRLRRPPPPAAGPREAPREPRRGRESAASGAPGRALLAGADATVAVSSAQTNGGLIQITTGAAHGRTTGDKVFITGVTGTTEANGGWIVTVDDATNITLQGSTFTNAYISGGTVRTGFGWTITDGGLAP